MAPLPFVHFAHWQLDSSRLQDPITSVLQDRFRKARAHACKLFASHFYFGTVQCPFGAPRSSTLALSQHSSTDGLASLDLFGTADKARNRGFFLPPLALLEWPLVYEASRSEEHTSELQSLAYL